MAITKYFLNKNRHFGELPHFVRDLAADRVRTGDPRHLLHQQLHGGQDFPRATPEAGGSGPEGRDRPADRHAEPGQALPVREHPGVHQPRRREEQ